MKVNLKHDYNSIGQEEVFGYDTHVYDIDYGEKGEISMILLFTFVILYLLQ